MTVEQFNGTYEALTPVSHGSDEDFGMEQRLRTIEMTVREDEEVYHEDVPVVSGNALRGQLRDLLAEDFLSLISEGDDCVKIHDTLSNSLYSGGSLERGSGSGLLKRRRIHNIREYIPPLSLLGCAIGSQMIESRLNMGMLIPIASETESYTNRESEQTVFEYVDTTFYTRMDDFDSKSTDHLDVDRSDDEQRDTQQMRYKIQILQPGTRLDHWMTLESANKVERACLGRAFELFARSPHIGGMQSIGALSS